MIRAIRKAAREAFREAFAPLILWDDFGTVRYCMSMREAMEWLPYCGNNAAVINRRTRVIEVSRHVSA
jgi:hypothetical protein